MVEKNIAARQLHAAMCSFLLIHAGIIPPSLDFVQDLGFVK